MDKESLKKLVKKKSSKSGFDFNLLDAIITVESGYNPYAMRYEKDWSFLETPAKFALLNKITIDTEIRMQMFSYGLPQIMGGTARWLSYEGPLSALIDPELSISLMILRLEKLKSMFQYKSDSDLIAAYNAGQAKKRSDGTYRNQAYVQKVLALLQA